MIKKFYDTIDGSGFGGSNKPYFAKILPVPGGIKVGDIVQANQDSLIGKYGPLLLPLSKAEIDDKEYSKVALYLCSRDVKIGTPNIWCEGYDKLFGCMSRDTKHGMLNLHIKENGEYRAAHSAKEEDCMAVIGLISPEATWIKEGDEFDEDQVKFKWRPNGYDLEGNLTVIKHIFRISVKCPCCNTFK